MRNLLTVIMLLITLEGVGQDSTRVLVSRKGLPILPEQGNWSIGLSTGPFLSYIGNSFNNTVNNPPPSFSAPGGNLVLKYMRSQTSAYRVKVGLILNSLDGKSLVQSVTGNNFPIQVMDTKTYSSTSVFLGFGLERRRGQGRLQGIYGVEASISLNSSKADYTYGNPLSVFNTNTPFTIWDDGSATPLFQTFGSSRTLKSSKGAQFGIGVSGFIGAEYFFAPKISLGGEVGILLRTAPAGSTSSTVEFVNSSNFSITTMNTDLPQGSTKLLLTTVTSGSLNLNIYF
ncbi:MAG TPA: hypothetical protein PK059_05550 [Cyclobacteriaceae bacterium]|nr:hypothetical protein [Cyclobacteriaceae bacterium]